MLQADAKATWVSLSAAIQLVGSAYGVKRARGLLMRVLVSKPIRWQYCTEQDPQPQNGPLDFWGQGPYIDWDGNRVQLLPRKERHVLQPGPPGQNKVKTFPAVQGGPPLYLVKLAREDIIAALPLVAHSTVSAPVPQPPRQKSKGGREPKLSPEQIERGQKIYAGIRANYPPEHPVVAATKVKELLKLDVDVDWKTIDRYIIRPKS